MLDGVHRGHGQAGAVDEAGDVAVELDVVEVKLACLDLQLGLLVEVAHFGDVFVPVQRVAVDGNLGVDGGDFLDAVRALDDAERVNLDHRGVALPPGFVHAGDELGPGVDQLAAQAKRLGQVACLIRLQTKQGIDVQLDDGVRVGLGDLLDVNTALAAGHDKRLGSLAVEQHGKIKLIENLLAAGDEQGVHLAPGFPGLLGDDCVAEHGLGLFVDVVG